MIKITDKEFQHLVDYIKKHYGINLQQKRILLEGRLNSYLEEHGLKTFSEYIKMLEADTAGKEITNLLNKVTTNHTFFMRESEHFTYLKNQVLPILERDVRDRDLRVWCAASSTGEEPYTLAMILQDYFGTKNPKWNTQLLASDISMKVLEMARHGVYSAESLKGIPELWKKKYFSKYSDDQFQVTANIKNEVVYRQFNLMDPIKAKKPYHVIFCRNVMIYFDMPTKAALVERMYNALCPGGFLFIGLTESLPKPSPFNYIMPSIYQKGG